MTAPATEPASESVEESLDDKIARLRKELEDAEIDQAGAELMKPVGNFMDWAPEFWDENTKEKPLEEIRAAAVFCKDAWAKFEAWRDAARTATRETTERRPYLALSPIAATVSFRAAFQKRPSGSGSTYRSGNGWKWRLQIAGNMKRGRTWPTREEAEAELALAVADPAFVPVRPDYKRLSPTSKHHCSRWGAGDHKANRCPKTAQEAAEGAGDPSWRQEVQEGGESAGGAGAPAADADPEGPPEGFTPDDSASTEELPPDDALLDDDSPPQEEAAEPSPPAAISPAATKPAKAFTPPSERSRNGAKKAWANYREKKAREAAGEEVEQPHVIQRRSDVEVAAIVEKFIPLAHKVARRFMWATTEHGLSIDYGDLLAEAQIGILKGARGWEEGAGENLTTHVFNRATWAIHRLIDGMRFERKAAADQIRKDGGTLAKFKSADAPIKNDDDSGSFLDLVADPSSVGHVATLADRDLYSKLMIELPPRTREILRLRFAEEMELDAIGKRFSLSRERVRQIEMSGLEDLRDIACQRGFDTASPRRWSPPDADGRRTHIACSGEGCPDCSHDGYLWIDDDSDGDHVCGACGKHGHYRPTCPLVGQPRTTSEKAESRARLDAAVAKSRADKGLAPPQQRPHLPSPPPPRIDPLVRRPIVVRVPGADVAVPGPSNPDYIHPGRGWGPVDANGIATHHLCNGGGKIRIKGESRKCYPCEGTGRRDCIRKMTSESAA